MQLDLGGTLDALVAVLVRLQGLLVTVSIVAVMAAMGAQLTRGDVVRTIREYNLSIRWVLTNLLAVPLFAVLAGVVFGLPGPVRIGLLLVAVGVSLVLSAVALFVIGAGITLLTGRSVLYSGLRQVGIGLAAAILTYGVGSVIGVTLVG